MDAQDVLVDHGRHPRHRGRLTDPTHSAEVTNPLCQDTVIIHLLVENDEIRDVKTDGEACAICTASASLMAEKILHQTVELALTLGKTLREAMLTGETQATRGDLAALIAIRAYPMRVKCVTLPWHALADALGETL